MGNVLGSPFRIACSNRGLRCVFVNKILIDKRLLLAIQQNLLIPCYQPGDFFVRFFVVIIGFFLVAVTATDCFQFPF